MNRAYFLRCLKHLYTKRKNNIIPNFNNIWHPLTNEDALKKLMSKELWDYYVKTGKLKDAFKE